jgi:predicted transcriptional regulator YdeE
LWERFGREGRQLTNPRRAERPEYAGLRIPGERWRDLTYVAGLVTDRGEDPPDGMVTRRIQGGRFLAFTHRGPFSEIDTVFDFLHDWWKRRSDYEFGDMTIELYGPSYDPKADDAEVKILVPLVSEE